jgi:deoxyribose-phosphate aldolase
MAAPPQLLCCGWASGFLSLQPLNNTIPVLAGIFYFYTMDIKQYLDATYLKTPAQAGLGDLQNKAVVSSLVAEAVAKQYKLVMVRPNMVATARHMINGASSGVLVGTVIDFPEGKSGVRHKLDEAVAAMANGADELDFVINYTAFIDGDFAKISNEVLQCTKLGLGQGKVVKWIIEIAALTDKQIAEITAFIRDLVVANFNPEDYPKVFVKSSTGFYITQDGRPNGATVEGVKIMLENAGPLPVKAAGGVRNYDEATAMVSLGVKRIGTSAARQIIDGESISGSY